jgi:hypothetical protein
VTIPCTITRSVQLGQASVSTKYVTSGTGLFTINAEVPPAKVGSLTTRTDDNTGELTMAASHGITTGARLDVYWEGGSRYGMTVGTVATNAVPIDGGSGDNLPADETPITAMVPIEKVLAAVGDNAKAIEIDSNVSGTIILADGSDVALLVAQVGGATQEEERSYAWNDATPDTNPIAGDTVASVFFSHGSSSATANMRAQVLVA